MSGPGGPPDPVHTARKTHPLTTPATPQPPDRVPLQGLVEAAARIRGLDEQIAQAEATRPTELATPYAFIDDPTQQQAWQAAYQQWTVSHPTAEQDIADAHRHVHDIATQVEAAGWDLQALWDAVDNPDAPTWQGTGDQATQMDNEQAGTGHTHHDPAGVPDLAAADNAVDPGQGTDPGPHTRPPPTQPRPEPVQPHTFGGRKGTEPVNSTSNPATPSMFARQVFPFTPNQTGHTQAWAPDGPVLSGGHRGGNHQAGDSWTVRYRPATPAGKPAPQYTTVLTDAWYPTEHPDQPGTYGVQQQRALTVCTDPTHPTDTTVWAHTEVTDDPGSFTSLTQATAHVQALAQKAILTGATHTLHPTPTIAHTQEGNPPMTGPDHTTTGHHHDTDAAILAGIDRAVAAGDMTTFEPAPTHQAETDHPGADTATPPHPDHARQDLAAEQQHAEPAADTTDQTHDLGLDDEFGLDA